jgi:hypothetical protein
VKKKVRTLTVIFIFIVAFCDAASAAEGKWVATLHSDDFIVGRDLQKLRTVHQWMWKFDGGFEVAVRKSSIVLPAPKCRMDYLILKMPSYYPESPAQASLSERQAVYDALVSIKKAGKGSLRVRFDALWYWQQRPSGPELTSCNVYFTLPLEKDAAKILP